MPCYKPLRGYRSNTKTQTGKRSIVFNPRHGFIDQPQDVPCGQCIGCRLERSRQWAIRIVHESQMHEQSYFLTLTYNNEFLPKTGSLQKADVQLFMKRLRKKFGKGIRYYYCGEYGEKFHRPHYHLIIFGCEFPDKILWKIERGNRLWISEDLNKLWKKGYCSIGMVTFESAAYVARYVTKKITGKQANQHYERKTN